MAFEYEALTAFSKSWGLFYLLAMALGVLIYTFWPSNKKKFDHAKHAVLRREDEP
ncbi:cbb3-type cytochrome c oxidase subunit 3 [Devosia sp. PTR5]|uniref:Cbb3-type cytochrome c oxidase subunit 3 n=1 Tax=Devosia oryzisoli TaxID=2774138 RepID=A0A927IRZ3_9HYPH|nr:cbb3-type cytochrome c oxidase subunit 3 [Devosia oryzisoli]MBD8067230.1 cbb3-type cytochrome c oxidase subunit 3 [Devosia oryzisoli]